MRHARARAQKVNRQVIGHANGNAMRCKGRCPITCLSANCHVRLLACPISADRQVIGQRARAQKVNRQVIGHGNGNAMRCKGLCPITCLSQIIEQASNRTPQRQRNALQTPVSDYLPVANCHVRLLACPISADRQVIGQPHGHYVAVTLPWPLPSHCESIAIT